MPHHPCRVFMMSGGTVWHHNECKASKQTLSHDRRTAAPPYSWRRQQRASHFYFLSSSSPTVVMVSLTSVSPLLYASPNINRQMASLINTHQTSWTHAPAPPPSPDSCHIYRWQPVLCDDRDYGNCAWDGNDAPDNDLIKSVCHNWARGAEVQIGRWRSYGCCITHLNKQTVMLQLWEALFHHHSECVSKQSYISYFFC